MGSRNQRNVEGSSGLGCVGIHDVGVQVSVSGGGILGIVAVQVMGLVLQHCL